MEFVIFAALTTAVVKLASRAGKKHSKSQPITPEEQKKREIADQVVVINETILK